MLTNSEMSQVENLAFVNRAVEQFGATHVLNIKIQGSGNIANLHTAVKNSIDTNGNHSIELGGTNYNIRWISGNAANSSAYFYAVTELSDIILLAHTRQVIINTIRQLAPRFDAAGFRGCEFVYSVTKTAGLINRLNVSEILSQ